MAGIKKVGAVPGRPPNRSDDLSRERDANRRGRAPVTKGLMREVVVPEANPNWHPIARMMYAAAQNSGMLDFYQQTDWAMIYSLMDDLSDMKYRRIKYGRVNGQELAVIYSSLSALGFTEGDRRRMRIELESPHEDEGPDAAVVAMDEYKAMLEVAQ